MWPGTVADQLYTMHHTWDTLGNFEHKWIRMKFKFWWWLFFYRSYISFDILRRVLANYFNYNVLYVMNITDIDDKIIKRARQNYLYEQYVSSAASLETILDDHNHVLDQLNDVIAKNTDPDKKTLLDKMLNQ